GGSLVITGNESLVNSAVTFWIGATQLGNTTSTGGGNWTGTATLPALAKGPYEVDVNNNGQLMWFHIFVFPSIVLTPSSGPVGTTVTATAFGFPADSAVFLYWFEHASGDSTYYNLFNATTGANGEFNVTVTFTVPHTYGGGHDVSASD